MIHETFTVVDNLQGHCCRVIRVIENERGLLYLVIFYFLSYLLVPGEFRGLAIEHVGGLKMAMASALLEHENNHVEQEAEMADHEEAGPNRKVEE